MPVKPCETMRSISAALSSTSGWKAAREQTREAEADGAYDSLDFALGA